MVLLQPMVERGIAAMEHLSAQRLAQSPEDDKQNDIGGVFQQAERSSRAFVEEASEKQEDSLLLTQSTITKGDRFTSMRK
jgi:hypothetical protein